MLKSKIAMLFFVLGCLRLSAEELMYKKYDWSDNPKIHELTSDEKEDNYTILKDKILLDFVYESSGELVLYETRHFIVHFNNEKGIEEMNKIYVPTSTVLEEVDLKARTITHDGKVIPLKKSAIKKIDNLEEKGPYTIFAMEGIDNGGEIEYLYTNKKNYKTNNVIYVQTDQVKKDISVDIYSPENLIYEGKGYNGFPEFTVDTVIKKRNHIYAAVPKVDALYEEKNSANDANKMRFEYQLTYNTSKSRARLYSWEYSGNNIYINNFTFEKGELKAADKFISKLGIGKLGSDELKIQALEQYMKTNINLKEINEFIPVDKMLDLKYGNESSFNRFYIAAAKSLEIPVEVVVTTNRMDRKFDNSFQSLNALQEYLIYYPTIEKFLCPSNYLSRLGFPPPALIGNKGLFVKETEVGDIKTGVAKVKKIDVPSSKDSYNNITASVTFNPETFTPNIKMKLELMGYSAYAVQPNLLYMEDDKKKEFLDNISKIMGVETIVKSASMEGTKSTDVLIHPLVIQSVLETPHLIENAGNKYLFKVGEMLGTQDEMYKDKVRKTDAEIFFTQSYTRLFDIKIPAGYKIKNLESINMDKRFTADGRQTACFISSYTQEGDILKIKVFEDYQVLTFPKEHFEEYRSVVNASADFNKVILIFEKI